MNKFDMMSDLEKIVAQDINEWIEENGYRTEMDILGFNDIDMRYPFWIEKLGE